MRPLIYAATGEAPKGSEYIGHFITDDGAFVPVVFRDGDQDKLHAKMLKWLEDERAKLKVSKEKLERRIAERAARKARAAIEEEKA